MNINTRIIETAKSFIDQEEIPGNLGFKDPKFEQLMKNVGWKETQAWCAYFAELVWKIAYNRINSLYIPILNKNFSASAVKTLENFKNAGWEINTSKKPKKGSLAVWQKYNMGNPLWSGHIGILVDINKNTINTIDGNTNDGGSREGIKVALKNREFNYNQNHGLVLKGFVTPKIP